MFLPRFASLLLLPLLASLTASYSTGAGNCPSGFAATGGTHRTGKGLRAFLRTGSVPKGGFNVKLMPESGANITLGANKVVKVDRGMNYTFIVEATDENFRGILARFAHGRRHSEPSSDVLVDEEKLYADGLRFANDTCRDKVLGLTHANPLEKEAISVDLSFEEDEVNMPLDLTIVVANRGDKSIYYYSRYWINVGTSSNRGLAKRIFCRFFFLC